MTWSQEMNEFVLRCYFLATNCESVLIGYRPEMRRLFLQQYPDYEFLTEQRLADQRNAIYRRNLINEIRRDGIRVEVECDIRRRNLGDSRLEVAGNLVIGHTPEIPPAGTDEESVSVTTGSPNLAHKEKLRAELEKAILEFQGMDPECRPLLPRLSYSKELIIATSFLDELIDTKLGQSPSFEDFHTALYCAAVTLTRYSKHRLISRSRDEYQPNVRRDPAWKRRLDSRVNALRVDIGRLTQWVRGNCSRRLRSKVLSIIRKYRLHAGNGELNEHAKECLDTATQKLGVLVAKRNRFWLAYLRRRDNTSFARNEKRFYRYLDKPSIPYNETPSLNESERYWKTIWSREEFHNSSAYWLTRFEQSAQGFHDMGHENITPTEVSKAISKSENWKAPGVDGIHAFYLKRFPCIHKHLARFFNEFLMDPHKMPPILTKGITYLLPKGDLSNSPENFRPITCLPVIYKIMTTILAERISAHCNEQGILAEQQKGCGKSSMGCKEQLTIDAVLSGQAIRSHRNLYAAYIDYKKAYDSVPHSWIIKVAATYKISPTIVEWLQQAMRTWRTCLSLKNTQPNMQNEIAVRRGIFQGDPLSPILFCLAINPLSCLLESSGFGFQIRTGDAFNCRISHLLYMDDLKLFAANQTQLQQMMDLTVDFSHSIKMQFGLEKCRTQTIIGGAQSVVGFTLGNASVRGLEPSEAYKYLGFHQAKGTLHNLMKEELTLSFLGKVRKILKTKLKAKFLVRAINSSAIPILSYSFGVIKWTQTDLDGLNRKLRVAFTSSGFHHPRASMERFNLPRCNGGRGILDIKKLHQDQVKYLTDYFHNKVESSHMVKVICRADDKLTPLNLAGSGLHDADFDHTSTLLEQWKGKSLHGRFPAEVSSAHIDAEASFAWLRDGYLHPETEGFLCAIQDQVVATRNYRKYIIGERDLNEDRCRLCQDNAETIQHITGACRIMAPIEYKGRHDDVAKIIHSSLLNLHGLGHTEAPYYKYVPESVVQNSEFKMYWDRTIYTDPAIAHNRPDITLFNLKEEHAYLIEISVPNNHNLQEVYSEKTRKYQELAFQMKRIYKLKKVFIVPLLVSSTGLIPKYLLEGLKILGLMENLYKIIQKAAILGTCRIVRKFLGGDS